MRIAFNGIKEMNVGDKIRIRSDKEDFNMSGLYDGIILEISEKLKAANPRTLETDTAIIVKYWPKNKSTGKITLFPVVRKLTDKEPVGYWYETVE